MNKSSQFLLLGIGQEEPHDALLLSVYTQGGHDEVTGGLRQQLTARWPQHH